MNTISKVQPRAEFLTAPAARWQHGQDEHEAPGQPSRVASGLAALRANGRIGDAEVVAAHRWQADYELGVLGAKDPMFGGGSGARSHDAAVISQIDALTRAREALAVMGVCMTTRLKLFLVDGLSCGAMADKFMPNKPRTHATGEISAQISLLLARLVEHYAACDRKGKTPR